MDQFIIKLLLPNAMDREKERSSPALVRPPSADIPKGGGGGGEANEPPCSHNKGRGLFQHSSQEAKAESPIIKDTPVGKRRKEKRPKRNGPMMLVQPQHKQMKAIYKAR